MPELSSAQVKVTVTSLLFQFAIAAGVAVATIVGRIRSMEIVWDGPAPRVIALELKEFPVTVAASPFTVREASGADVVIVPVTVTLAALVKLFVGGCRFVICGATVATVKFAVVEF
jgi:hypothetical protein